MDVLPTIWFIALAVLWCGYIFLEGFDFGVGMLLNTLGRGDREKRAMINTIGPVWDGNEVWLITAGGATFAAFPLWYASLMHTMYVPLILFLLALIVRGVSFEYRAKFEAPAWQRTVDWAITLSSFVAALGAGWLLAGTSIGLPINETGDRVGGPFASLSWHAALGMLAIIGFSLLQGALYVANKTTGKLQVRAEAFAQRWAVVLLLPIAAWAIVIQFVNHGGRNGGTVWTWAALVVAVLFVVYALGQLWKGREGRAFGALFGFLAFGVAAIFGAMYPLVMPSTVDPAFSLTGNIAASNHYTLVIMTIAACVFLPVVLAYQAWTYWVFRARIDATHIPDEKPVVRLPTFLRRTDDAPGTGATTVRSGR